LTLASTAKNYKDFVPLVRGLALAGPFLFGLTPTSFHSSTLSSPSVERGLCDGEPSLRLAAERVVERSKDRVSQ
jgi:hypothetical protein